MSDTPLASYEDPALFPMEFAPVGKRGYSGVLATLTTSLAGANNDLIITAKNASYGIDPPVKIQYAVLYYGAPGGLYQDGYPSMLIPATDLGFRIIMKKAGSWGNHYTVTLVNPGRVAPLLIERPAVKDLVINLAYASSAPTTTPAQLIAAINDDPELGEYMFAFASSATTTALPALATTSFTGGSDVPGLVLVSLANTAGTSTATGTAVGAILNGSRYVSAVNAAGNSGAGTVVAMPATALVGGTANRGAVSDQYLTRRDAREQKARPGIPLGKENNKTIEVRSSRLGAIRTWQRVPLQDRAVVAASPLSLQTDDLAAKNLG